MANSNSRKPKNVSQKTWDKKIRQNARELYERGIDLTEIEDQLGISFELLNDWKFMDQWEILPELPISVPVVQKQQIELASDNGDLVFSTIEANEKLLAGYRLVQQTSQDALLNDNIKFKDKKQAADAFVDSLKGEVSVLGVDLSQQFLLDIAKIIREEVKDEETLQRLGERLVAIGRLYNARLIAQGAA